MNGEKDLLVWHYTDANGMIGIIENRQLWATHSRLMNDPMEGSVMYGALNEYIERETELSSNELEMVKIQRSALTENWYPSETNIPGGNMFIVSASTERDALTMWRNYTGDQVGYAVGLDSAVALGPILDKRALQRKWCYTHEWDEVDYIVDPTILPDEYEERIREAARKTYDGDNIVEVSRELQRMLAKTKHHAYRDEREVRVAFFEEQLQNWKFRSIKGRTAPYITVGVASEWGKYSDGSEPLPIREIWLSPNANESDVMALNALLELNGFSFGSQYEEVQDDQGEIYLDHAGYVNPVRIKRSSHPFRY